MGIVEEYLSLTKKWKNEYGEKTIVLMQVGSFFEVYALEESDGSYSGSNIVDFSLINDMVISNKQASVYNKPVKMAGFGTPQLEKYVKKLQERDYTVCIYVQDIQGKNTSRSLAEIISPGTFFNSEQEKLSNNIICIWLHASSGSKMIASSFCIGVSVVDVLTGNSFISQFQVENFHNPCTYDELEKMVSVYKPSECIFISNVSSHHNEEVMQYIGIENCKIHNILVNDETTLGKNALNAEKQIYQAKVFSQFFPDKEDIFKSNYTEHFIAMQSFTFLLDFVYQHSPHLVNKLTMPEFHMYTEKLILANHSLKQLNMLDDDRHIGKCKSVASLLNNSVTCMGKRAFAHTINNPLTSPEPLSQMYNITEYLLNSEVWEKYRTHLTGISDMEKFARKLVIKRTSPKDLAIFTKDLSKIREIYKLMKKDKDFFKLLSNDKTGSSEIFFQDISKLINNVIKDIEKSFNIEQCSRIDDMTPDKLVSTGYSSSMETNTCNVVSNFIREKQSEKIDAYREMGIDGRIKINAIKDLISNIIKEQEKSAKTSQFVKIHETVKSDPNLQTTSRRATILKNALTKINDKVKVIPYTSSIGKCQTFELDLNDIEIANVGSSKSQKIIKCPLIDSICAGLQAAKDKLVQESILFFNNFIEEYQKHLPSINTLIQYVARVDLEQCRCYIANKYNYCKPEITINDKSMFDVQGIRHPLIEHLQTQELYVTNDLQMGLDYDGLLLYGTNAVGKTSLIKSIGIAIIMAQAGLYVAASSFKYTPYKHIFTRILGNDNIFKGLSTFAVEMSELRTILKYCDKNSLILGDELCSGTESDSALSIFTAGLEHLHEIKATFLFATHFHEVNNYDEIKALNKLKMMHMTVTYDSENKILIYDRKLKNGPGESMYGLEVCKSLNLNHDFLQRAHDIRMKYNPSTQNPLSIKSSHFNAKKLKGLCEICKKDIGTEVHHLAHQVEANKKNQYINSFHKNHVANLINICEKCHDKLHSENAQHKKTKTSKGIILTET